MALGDRFRMAVAAGLPNRNGFLGYAIQYQEWLDFYRAADKAKLTQDSARLSSPTASQSPRFAALRRVLREQNFKNNY
ncbi:MAG: hypothetical protein SOZ90_08470 [Candidatus Faecousia sp.]|nr:hypothetical protein [Candidatus Faecousia sp.]